MARPKREPTPVFVDEDAKAREDIAEFHRMRELMGGKFTDVEIRQKIEAMPPETRQKVAQMVATLTKRFGVAKARLDFAEFAKRMDPDRLPGRHFDILTKAFHRIADGEEVKLIINIAPRRGKSEYTSYLFPSWFIGRFPKKKILHITNVKTLAADFGAKIRNLLDTPEYQEVFPNVKLSKDASAKDKWRTNYKGEYFAAGIGSTIYGRGGDLCIVDDPHSESESIDGKMEPPSKEDYDATWNWIQSAYSRVHPGGSILVVMQRWSKHDLTGRLIDAAKRNSKSFQWEVVTIPALEEYQNAEGDSEWRSTWPEFWPTKAVIQLRETMMSEPGGAWRWNSMYQQDPSADVVSMMKREHWKRWEDGKRAPVCEFVIQSWDMAATKNDKSNYSACTTWGVFRTSAKEDKGVYNIILLDAERGKWDFPDLKKAVVRKYNSVVKDGHPDCLLVENKSAGIQLIQELRETGVPVTSYRPTGNQYTASNDKISRVNRILEMFTSGLVWAPKRAWAEEVIEECAEFPNGQYDDYVDTVSQALAKFREGGFIRFDTDEEENDQDNAAPMAFYNLG